ncbi:hypothetical protein [Elizabethkingia meningoseptica]|uniref:hypothetical protein n=1 Tax=Elizabethkingia meningoseptica TaxID=238 RepID=UPI0009955513|nr:hypothetical protein [Elizabethkingia meningoseptica]AQX12672.1 hypothetical protein BBD35_09940 [Elizabethkingia meningoseptica]OPB77098.1 hypothetical protein BAY31_03495 [Elizabethkingia meningoseptica]
MDYKAKLVSVFNKCPFLDKSVIAREIEMDPRNFRRYITNNETPVTEKVFNKIFPALQKAQDNFYKALNDE